MSERVELRCSLQEKERWAVCAGGARNLSDWLRAVANAAANAPHARKRLNDPGLPPDRDEVKPVTPIVLTDTAKAVRPYASERPRAKRSTMCEHRRRPDEFCPRCD